MKKAIIAILVLLVGYWIFSGSGEDYFEQGITVAERAAYKHIKQASESRNILSEACFVFTASIVTRNTSSQYVPIALRSHSNDSNRTVR